MKSLLTTVGPLALLMLAAGGSGSLKGQESTICLPDDVQSTGAKYRICRPPVGKWNGDLVIYAHGYKAFNEPIEVPNDKFADGVPVEGLLGSLGYAYGTTSYSVNGLAIQQGIADLVDLVAIFKRRIGAPRYIFLVGPSEGGIITTLAMERFPNLFTGGIAACGPIGDFPAQINYIGDFRALFDYFFPGILIGSPTDVPPEMIEQWEAKYVPAVKAAIKANPKALAELLNVSGAPKESPEDTVITLLWYAVFTANDAKVKLGGQPYENRHKFYLGSSNDALLNQKIARSSASPAALEEMKAKYNTTGKLARPLTTVHTTGDQIIPYWHEPIYGFKAFFNGAGSLQDNVIVFRYGHCNFNAAELLVSFVFTVLKSTGQAPANPEAALPNEESRQRFRELLKQLANRR